MQDYLFKLFLDTGNAVVTTWIFVVVVAGTFMALARIFTHVRKIQDRKYRWSVVRHELKWSALNISITTIVLKTFSSFLVDQGWLVTDTSPAAWYVVVFEFFLFFFVFDLYFYAIHRFMHIQPFLYKTIHLTHHRSTTPNPLSSSSMNPIEGVLEGLIIPIFLAAYTVHETSALFIAPFATIMGLYVHCGYEVVPRWWYKSWATKWFITPMFHDQHHQYFNYNYGAFTTIWDRVFKTVRGRFDEDFDKLGKQKKTEIPNEEVASV